MAGIRTVTVVDARVERGGVGRSATVAAWNTSTCDIVVRRLPVNRVEAFIEPRGTGELPLAEDGPNDDNEADGSSDGDDDSQGNT